MTTLVMTVVALNALVVNATYRLQTVQEQQRALTADGRGARGSRWRGSPRRRASPSGRADNGMRMPASDEVDPAPGARGRGSGAPA